MKNDKVYNICLCTTYGWNPGDEIIMSGIKNILMNVIKNKRINWIIYNRHPDIRSQYPQYLKDIKVPSKFEENDLYKSIEANLKIGMFDNSIKPNYNGKFIDLVIFAGTPEWCNGRCYDLYKMILDFNIPTMYIGVGSEANLYRDEYLEVINKSLLFTVRDTLAYLTLEQIGVKAQYIACPSLVSANESFEKNVTEVKKIGLIYVAASRNSVIWNGGSDELYNYELFIYRHIIKEYGNQYTIEIICHYIDELPLAYADFPTINCRYSYDAQNYKNIYHEYDLVIGPRVHGIGCAASMLIPGIAILHDTRGETCEGFLADTISMNEDISKTFETINSAIANIKIKSDNLRYHKRRIMNKYIELVDKALRNKQDISYENKLDDFYRHEKFETVCDDLKEMVEAIRNNKLFSIVNKQENIQEVIEHPQKDDSIKEKIKRISWRSWKNSEERDSEINLKFEELERRFNEETILLDIIRSELKELAKVRVKMDKLNDIQLELERIKVNAKSDVPSIASKTM